MIDYYEPDIVTAQDYYPFGMMSRVSLPNSDVPYKFGFNGKMNDNEVKGGFGLQQDYGMRIYDNRVGRFLSVDPISSEYPWYSPYHFAGNTPVNAKDLDGLEPAYPYMDKKGVWRESKGGDNTARKNLPSGHLQFLRNSSSLPNEQQLREQWASSLNFIPYLGQIKSFSEGITGEEWFTGRQLSSTERKAAIFLPMKFAGGNGIVAQEVKQEFRALSKEEAAALGKSGRSFFNEVKIDNDGKYLGGSFKFVGISGKEREAGLLANYVVNGKTLELTDAALYITGLKDKEGALEMGKQGTLSMLNELKNYAKKNGFEELKISYKRSAQSSSKAPGHTYQQVFNLKE